MSKEIIKSIVEPDDITDELSKAFDYVFEGETTFELHRTPNVGTDFSIGLIVGASGSGKSLLLEDFGEEAHPKWDRKKAVASHFKDADEATARLMGVGFNSIPSWMKPYHVLSNGEQYRVNLARILKSGCVVDEFTSVVDRTVAKSCAHAIQKYIRSTGMKNIVFATCHFDVIDWLLPDWVYNTDTKKLHRRSLQQRRPEIKLDILTCDSALWEMFKKHHYLTTKINPTAKCFAAVWEGTVVGFASAITLPHGSLKNAWRGHRTVILPDFQGLGIGVRLSDAMAQLFINADCRFYSRTAHPRMIEYRCGHPEAWRVCSGSGKPQTSGNRGNSYQGSEWKVDLVRACYSFEYIAPKDDTGSIHDIKQKYKGLFD